MDSAIGGQRGRRASDFPWVAITPDGAHLYVVYNNYQQAWQNNTNVARLMEGVLRHALTATPGAWADVHRGVTGDARGSSANGLTAEFLGDYNYVMATNDLVVAVWNDVRNAADCPDIDAYRGGLAGTNAPAPRPEAQNDCAPNFGNTDIFSYSGPVP